MLGSRTVHKLGVRDSGAYKYCASPFAGPSSGILLLWSGGNYTGSRPKPVVFLGDALHIAGGERVFKEGSARGGIATALPIVH